MGIDYKSTENRVKFAGTWYELDDFAKNHPGGDGFINIFNGRDVTHAFRSYHPHFTDKRISSVLRKVKDEDIPSELDSVHSNKNNDKKVAHVVEKHAMAYKELQKEVLAALGGFRNSKGTYLFFLKSFLITAVAIGMEAMQWVYGFTLIRAILLGCVMALIGLNIQHDANHGAASLNPKINYALGLLQDWIGGSAIHWRHHHVVLHHIHTNTEADPDVRAKPVLRVHPKDEPDLINRFQHLYIWPILSLFGLRIILLEPFDLATGIFGNEDRSQVGNTDHRFAAATKNERIFSLFLRALFYIRFIVLPMVFIPEWNTAYCIYATIASGSFYLGGLFILSHNFTDVKFHPSNGDNENLSFMAAQVETSSNWGDWFAIQMCGGLNCKYTLENLTIRSLN